MELEFHQLEMRYAELRARCRERWRQLLVSLEEHGQQQPIVVVAHPDEANRYVVIDGYLRIEALRRLKRDTVDALVWDMEEPEALVLQWQMSHSPASCALEQGWLLAELQHRFGWSQEELARRFVRSASWVSRRLGLVRELPLALQDSIRRGQIPAQAGIKVLVPMARSNPKACQRLAQAIVEQKLTSPEIQALYAAWQTSSEQGRQRLLKDPRSYLQLRQKLIASPKPLSEPETFVRQVERLAQQGRRLAQRLPYLIEEFSHPQRDQLRHLLEDMTNVWLSALT